MKIIKLYSQSYPTPRELERKELEQKQKPALPAVPPITYPDFDVYNVENGNVDVTIDRYPNSRFWQVNVNGKLLAVVVYRKGAEAIKNLVTKLSLS